MPQLGRLADLVEGHVDGVAGVSGDDIDATVPGVAGDERRGPEALEGVAELAPGRADVVGLVADPRQVVERPHQDGGGQARAVVGNGDGVAFYGDLDPRGR